jgi:predicted homoserine dehydrogenase-like protein
MLDADYIKVFKILGKLCYGYDISATQFSDINSILATLQDQVATGLVAENPVCTTLRPNYSQIEVARDNGAANAQSVFQAGAEAVIVSDYFVNKLVTVPASRTIEDVLAALETEMSAAVDNKKLTTLHSTGLVNFFNSMLAAPGTWNTITDASADYKDSVYVVLAVV